MVNQLFSAWLLDQLHQRGWSQAELARRANITKGAISHVLNETRRPGEALCKAIADALGYPPETVFRAAGLLPTINAEDADLEKWMAKLALLTPEKRELLWRIMEVMDLDPRHQAKEKRTTSRSRKGKSAISGNAT